MPLVPLHWSAELRAAILSGLAAQKLLPAASSASSSSSSSSSLADFQYNIVL
jgi:hypothetical protein